MSVHKSRAAKYFIISARRLFAGYFQYIYIYLSFSLSLSSTLFIHTPTKQQYLAGDDKRRVMCSMWVILYVSSSYHIVSGGAEEMRWWGMGLYVIAGSLGDGWKTEQRKRFVSAETYLPFCRIMGPGFFCCCWFWGVNFELTVECTLQWKESAVIMETDPIPNSIGNDIHIQATENNGALYGSFVRSGNKYMNYIYNVY